MATFGHNTCKKASKSTETKSEISSKERKNNSGHIANMDHSESLSLTAVYELECNLYCGFKEKNFHVPIFSSGQKIGIRNISCIKPLFAR